MKYNFPEHGAARADGRMAAEILRLDIHISAVARLLRH